MSDFPNAQVAAQVAAHNSLAAILSQVRRDIAQPLLEEVGRQLELAARPQQADEDLITWERARARALLTALICAQTAIEAWLNRTLEDDHPDVWPEVERLEFMAKVRLLAKLMTRTPPTPGRSAYNGTLDPDKAVYNGLKDLSALRNEFIHYKAQSVAMGSAKDPYEKLKKLPRIVKKLEGLATYGLVIPKT